MARGNPETRRAYSKSPKRKEAVRIYQKRPEIRKRLAEYAKSYYHSHKDIQSKRMRERHLRKKYGLTLGEYDILLQSQNEKCAICQRSREEKMKASLVVDHSHETGKIRGLLCSQCNSAIGLVKEDIDVLYAMIEYIKKFW